MGFLREIDPTVTKPIDGIKGKVQNLGLQYAVAGIIDKDVMTLADVLVRANKGFNPRLTVAEVETYIEDDRTDIDRLFDDVLGFLKSANVTKNTTQTMIEAVEAEKAKAATENT
jgi:hypothetical protein